MKVLCVLLPHFLLRCELQRHPEITGAALLTHTVGSQRVVLDYSPELDGLQPDMPLQQAVARYGEAKILPADVPYYWSVFSELLDGLEDKYPLVEGSELGRAYLNVDGMQLIYPNYKSLINAVREVIRDTFTAQIGIAEGKFLAYLAARHSSPGEYQILTDNTTSFLKNISCNDLPVSTKTRNKLHNFGLHTLGQLVMLPTGPLQAQFGTEGKRLWEFARGYDDTPLHPRCKKEIIEESTALISVTVSVETILVTLEVLLARVFVRIRQWEMGIRNITLWTRSWNGTHWERSVRFKEPAMDIKSTISRIKQLLENFPQPGAVEQLGIKVTRLGCRSGRQRNLFSDIRAKEHLVENIKQLESRLEKPQVFRIKEVEPWSRLPERQYALKPLGQ